MYQVVASSSAGNAVIYHNSILVDCGIPFVKIKPFLKDLKLILLTHEHGDHLNISTIIKILELRPGIRIACGEWLMNHLQEFSKNVDVLYVGNVYDYGICSVVMVALYHDVPNCGWRIFKGDTKIFHATDTAHLFGITAKDYDLYAIEHNYNEDTIFQQIAEIEAQGGFAHQKGSINSHLSEQQAQDFIFANKCENSKYIRLHESKSTL